MELGRNKLSARKSQLLLHVRSWKGAIRATLAKKPFTPFPASGDRLQFRFERGFKCYSDFLSDGVG